MFKHRRFERSRKTHGFLGFTGYVMKNLIIDILYRLSIIVVAFGVIDLVFGFTVAGILKIVIGGITCLLFLYRHKVRF